MEKTFEVIPVEDYGVIVDKSKGKDINMYDWDNFCIDDFLLSDSRNVIVATIGKRLEGIPLIEIPDEVTDEDMLRDYPDMIYLDGKEFRGALTLYKAAQSKGTYTEEDMRVLLRFINKNYEVWNNAWIDRETGNKHRLDDDLLEEFHQSLQKKKLQPNDLTSPVFNKAGVMCSITANRCSGCGAKAEIYNERWDLYVCGSPNCKPDDIMRDLAHHALTGQ